MKIFRFTLSFCCLLFSINLYSQAIKLDKSSVEPVHVYMSIETLTGKEVVRVIKDSAVKDNDAPSYAKIKGVEFKDGTIELKVLSRLLPNAPESARGFIGVGFRINDSNSRFEGIYIRPTNGRADDQLRRNHATQYFSFPDYSFDRLRKESPGVYESYSDMGLNEWIKLKITVKGVQAKLFINDNMQPALIVNDLKLGANASGGVGLWVDVGTEGFFSDVKMNKN